MDGISERAARWGIEAEHWDELGRHWTVEPTVLEHILNAIVPKRGITARVATTPDVAHRVAYQGSDTLPRRSWAIVVQLFGVRSRRNWGHGDFTDLANLIDIASALGA